MKYHYLSQQANVFRSCTGLYVSEFDQLVEAVLPRYVAAEEERLHRPNRQRAPGGGRSSELGMRDQILLTVVWLRLYPTQEVLGYCFGVSDSTVSRTIQQALPVLEAAGRDTMRMPDPGKKRRRQLPELLAALPELMVMIDTFEQQVQRPEDPDEADGYYSGKKKRHTLKSQVAVDETGHVVDVAERARGPTADIILLEESKLLKHLPPGVGVMGDLAYVGIDKLHPEGLGFAPRRKPRGKPRPPEDKHYNTAFSRVRIVVENTIGRMRRYQSITQVDRHHRQLHTERVVAIAGLVNRQIGHRLPA